MMTERNFIKTVFKCKMQKFRPPLRGTPVAIHLSAGFKPPLHVDFYAVRMHIPRIEQGAYVFRQIPADFRCDIQGAKRKIFVFTADAIRKIFD